jgi:hypothetical protein
MMKSKFMPIVILLTIILFIPVLTQAGVSKRELQNQINDLQDQIDAIPDGPPGPPGTDGNDFLYIVSEDRTLPTNSSSNIFPTCSVGDPVLGGGGEPGQGSLPSGLTFTANTRTGPNTRTWFCSYLNVSGSEQSVTCFALCYDLTP